MKIAQRAKGVTPSLTLAMTARANKLKAEGIKLISFGAGEPDFSTPDYIVDGAKFALDKGMTKYTPSAGTLALRQAICDKFSRDNGLIYKPNQIVVSNGAKHSVYNALAGIIDPGEEVIIPAPFWLTYPELVKLCDGVPVIVHTTEASGFKITPAQLSRAITPKTRAIILNTPSNPCGSVYSQSELAALASIIEKSGIYVISDEIYEKLVYGVKHYSIASYSPRLLDATIVVNGVSKTYSMTGWRIGYTACNVELATAIDNMQSHMTSNANSIAQHATLVALGGGDKFLSEMLTTFDTRRKLIVGLLKDIPLLSCIVPEGAFYVMVNVHKLYKRKYKGEQIGSAQHLAELLLEHERVTVIPAEAFGAEDYIRLSYAISEQDITSGIALIKQFVSDTN